MTHTAKMNRYWENQSGAYDPVVKEVIENENKRNKEIHSTVKEIKKILKNRGLILLERIKLKDITNNKTYK